MSVYEITFSPSGGTKRVSNTFGEAFCKERTQVDLTDREKNFSEIEFTKEDICIVAVPSYAGRVPEIAIERLSEMTGNGALAILIVVYGNRAFEDTLLELYDTLTGRGFRCVAAISAIAEHSIMRQYAAGRPNAEDSLQLTDYAVKIQKKIEKGKFSDYAELPGNRPYKPYSAHPMKLEVDDSCSKCGICVGKCPVGAISKENPKDIDLSICISCMRCVSVCPNHARKVNEEQLTALSDRLEDVCKLYKKYELYYLNM